MTMQEAMAMKEATVEEVEAVRAAVTAHGYYSTTSAVMRASGLSRTRAVRALRASGLHEYPSVGATYWGVKKEH